MKMLEVRNFFSTSHLYFSSRLSNYKGPFIFIYFFIVITFLIWYSEVFVFQFICSLGNRYF